MADQPDLGDFAILTRLTFASGGDVTCQVQINATGQLRGHDPQILMVTGTRAGTLGGGGTNAETLQVHAMDLADTRTDAEGQWWTFKGSIKYKMAADSEFFFYALANNVQVPPADADVLGAGQRSNSYEQHVSCSKAFVRRVEAGNMFLFTPQSLERGVGAGIAANGFNVGASVADTHPATFSQPMVRFMVLRVNEERVLGAIDVKGPSETWTWDITAPPLYERTGPAGRYDLSTRFLFTEGFWGALMGVDPIESLDEVRVDITRAVAP